MSRTQVTSVSGNLSKEVRATDLLLEHVKSGSDGCLLVSNGFITWYLYLEGGQLIYATHSADPFDHLDRHLRNLSRQNSSLTNELRTQVRVKFSANPSTSTTTLCPDYQAISWLVLTATINQSAAGNLVEAMSREVLESYILLQEGTYKFVPKSNEMAIYCNLEPQPLLQECQERIKAWQALGPEISSPYQRPCLSKQNTPQQSQSEEKIQKLKKILRGFSFRHLAILLNLDELKLAQSLRPLILNGTIQLKDALSPFDQLPSVLNVSVEENSGNTENKDNGHQSQQSNDLKALGNTEALQKEYVIACIDDSPAILNTINRYLQDHDVSVVMISDPVKALMQIMRAKPDLILLDVGMPWVDGYELCRLVRKNSKLKKIPIVMVTGNTGLIDRSKAKLSGANDYMTKPFTQVDLLKMVFRHLS